jgi:hypothetical protein
LNVPAVIPVAGAARGNVCAPEGDVHAANDFVDLDVAAVVAVTSARRSGNRRSVNGSAPGGEVRRQLITVVVGGVCAVRYKPDADCPKCCHKVELSRMP